jgi:hypothetical protein
MTRARDNSFNPFNNNYAGKNVLINGAMDVWQRGTSFPATGPGAVIYSADRWTCYAGNTGTISRDSSFAPVGFENSLKFTSTINSSGIDFYQLIETKNVIPLQGKTVTLSAYVAGTNGKTAPGMTAYYSTTTDDMIYLTSGVLMQVATVPAALSSTSFQRMSMTFTVPSTAKTIRIGLISSTLNNTEFINWTGVQLEVGTIPTPFSRSGGTIGGELSLCQRYYEKSYNHDVAIQSNTTQGISSSIDQAANTTSTNGAEISFRVPKRTPPTIATYRRDGSATNSNYWQLYIGVTGTYLPVLVDIGSKSNRAFIPYFSGTSGLTANNAYSIIGHWTADAEL